MIIDDLPSGSVWMFFVNIFISFFFQIIGFILTHLLHTSHAAKFGSRAGLGLTLIQYGFYYRSMESDDATEGDDAITWPPIPATTPDSTGTSAVTNPDDVQVISGLSMRDWISFILMTAGKWPFNPHKRLPRPANRLVPCIIIHRWFLAR